MIWKAENVGGGIIKKAETGETDKNATDQDQPITTDLRYLSLTANNIIAKLTNQVIDLDLTHSTDNKYSLHSDDDFRSGGRNVSHHYRQHFSSGLDYTHLEDQTTPFHVIPEFKPFTVILS